MIIMGTIEQNPQYSGIIVFQYYNAFLQMQIYFHAVMLPHYY